MPKERIYTPNIDFEVIVGWQQDVGVQLATVRAGSHSYDPADGLYVDLSRDGINRLIKTLRKARDQAFGKDE